jgi:hypothetical protein
MRFKKGDLVGLSNGKMGMVLDTYTAAEVYKQLRFGGVTPAQDMDRIVTCKVLVGGQEQLFPAMDMHIVNPLNKMIV